MGKYVVRGGQDIFYIRSVVLNIYSRSYTIYIYVLTKVDGKFSIEKIGNKGIQRRLKRKQAFVRWRRQAECCVSMPVSSSSCGVTKRFHIIIILLSECNEISYVDVSRLTNTLSLNNFHDIFPIPIIIIIVSREL